jgi:hypothetical protein
MKQKNYHTMANQIETIGCQALPRGAKRNTEKYLSSGSNDAIVKIIY